ncbi:MAG: hypothetical protein PVH89_07295 [Gammaproteobacteria bacterium]|jgi:hypothetical protein
MSGRIEDRLKMLKSLPELEPPDALEQSTLAAMAAASAGRPSRPSAHYVLKAAAWVIAVGIGAWLTIWATGGEQDFADERAVETVRPAVPDELYFELAEQSMQLEEILALIPPPRRVMRTDTASTIVGLEDRIAWIDAELHRAESSTAPSPYREALMRDRVEVLNALVNVRYAQSRAFVF